MVLKLKNYKNICLTLNDISTRINFNICFTNFGDKKKSINSELFRTVGYIMYRYSSNLLTITY